MYYFLIILITILSSCTYPKKSYIQERLRRINSEIKLSDKKDYGGLIAKYGLLELSETNSIFSPNFVRIINEIDSYNLFLKQIRMKKIANIDQAAYIKTKRIQCLLSRLDKKYKFFSVNELKSLRKIYSDKSPNKIAQLSQLDTIINTLPIMFPEHQARITSYYGNRGRVPRKKSRFHFGIDIQGGKSCGIYAAADGIVVKASKDGAYGNIIEIKHYNKFSSRYAHLNKIYKKAGDKVFMGEKIGTQGRSGRVFGGEHLHFEILLNGKRIDPFNFLSHACNS
jgi:murein DD-endopeptidase MepM/ murein hydrolase activator NlpD